MLVWRPSKATGYYLNTEVKIIGADAEPFALILPPFAITNADANVPAPSLPLIIVPG